MKKTIFGIAIFAILVLAGCTPYENWDPETYNFPHKEKFKSVQEIVNWTSRNIKWVSDKSQYSNSDYWALPEQTYLRKEGDCDDFTILAMYFAHEIGIDSTFTEVSLLFKNGDSGGHAILKAEGLYWEPLIGWVGGSATLEEYGKKVWGSNLSVISYRGEISYEDTIRWAMDHHIIKRMKQYQQ